LESEGGFNESTGEVVEEGLCEDYLRGVSARDQVIEGVKTHLQHNG
jgi:hypothetical protein